LTRRPDPNGFILLFVLWILAVVALVVTRLTVAAHAGAGIASGQRASLVQEVNASSAVYTAAFHLLDRAGTPWDTDDRPHALRLNGRVVEVRAVDEADKVNLNTASADLLRELLIGAGVDPATAEHLGQAIVDWREEPRPPFNLETKGLPYQAAGLPYRPPGAPFRSIAEVHLVLGLTPEILHRIRPHVTIYSTYGPGGTTADPVVRDALRRVRATAGLLPLERAGDAARVVRVTATAIGPDRARFTRIAVLRLASQPQFAILTWESGNDADQD
jgi:general secretion pathway protein K